MPDQISPNTKEHSKTSIILNMDDVFHSPPDVQFLASQRGEELLALSVAHSVHTLGEVVQRVKAYLSFLKD